MTLRISTLLCGLLLATAAITASAQEVSARAQALHQQALVLDTHLDTPANFPRPGWDISDDHSHDGSYSQVDLPRMRKGGLDGGFWVIYTGQGARDAEGNRKARDHGLLRMTQIHEMLAAHPDTFELALSADDAERIAGQGKRVVFISMENASPLASDPSLLSAYHALGLRMLGITHVLNNDFGDSSTDKKGPEWNGLSPAGKALVAQANRLGIVLDGSHASDQVVEQLIALSKTPIVLSHTSAKDVFGHPRNIDDALLRKLAASGGVIHVNAYGGYLIDIPANPEREQALQALADQYPDESQLSEADIAAILKARQRIDQQYPARQASFDDYMRHLLHILKVAGPEHVGIGADWDGGGGVLGLANVGDLPRITQALLDAGYSDAEIKGIWGGNLLRVLRAVQAGAEPAGQSS
ncbi:dipeptidase [Pseudoxanthomonas dokdonensis]|uniref:Peptidase M19 n=1 Tax=Pseudoxanthomonas dokdonensis TaxID=344882 RepID=A0A0R0CP18_9GAMM|nr:dipeptidase [Pseudoxanthomonas dokdonensis]KRG67623.1 peptidase M19 [Pseudoxanthomonas dokdonensis]